MLILCSYRFWWRAVVLAECLIFRNIRIEIVHLRTIMNSVSQAPNHQVLPGEGLQHGHLLLLGRLIAWTQNNYYQQCGDQCLHEPQATVTPPSSESENLMRNVPTSLDFRNSSAS